VESLDELLSALWEAHGRTNPEANRVRRVLFPEGHPGTALDHVAVRTLDHPKLGIARSARLFERHGYRAAGERRSKDGTRTVRRYLPALPGAPAVIISELQLAVHSRGLRDIVGSLVRQFDPGKLDDAAFALAARPWHPVLHESYERLQRESPFAAWVAAFGPAPQHVTIRADALPDCGDLETIAARLADCGLALASSPDGDAIRCGGRTDDCVATAPAPVPLAFADGTATVPGGHCEFVWRRAETATASLADALEACTDWLSPDEWAQPEPGV